MANSLATMINDIQLVLRDPALQPFIAIGLAALFVMFLIPPVRKLMLAIAALTIGLIAMIIVIHAFVS